MHTGHIGTELEENLGSIQEVNDFIKIVRSFALISLRFLKNLRIIHGKRQYTSRWVREAESQPPCFYTHSSVLHTLVWRFCSLFCICCITLTACLEYVVVKCYY